MKLGCSSWSYHRAILDKRLDQQGWLRLCAEELELDGVELLDIHFPTLDKDYLRDIKRACTDTGLTISCVSVSNDFGLADIDARDREVAKVKQWVNITSFFGAPVLRVFAGWYPHGTTKSDAAVSVRCGSVILSEGHMGRVGDHVAVRVTKPLRRPRTTFAMFENADQSVNRMELP